MQGMPSSTSQLATDYFGWPIKELRRLLQEKGVDVTGMVEKAELVEKARNLEAEQSHQVTARVVYLILTILGYRYLTRRLCCILLKILKIL